MSTPATGALTRLPEAEVRLFAAMHATVSKEIAKWTLGLSRPVDAAELCEVFGLRLRSLPLSGHHAGSLVRDDDGWVVVVGSAGGKKGSPRERLTVAHEIAHYLIECNFDWRPRTSEEYWALEKLCDSLGGDLLADRDGVARILAGEASKLEHAEGVDRALLLLRSQRRVARAYGLSEAAASWRLLDAGGRPASFIGVELRSPKNGVLGVVKWVAELTPWFGGSARTYLWSDSMLAEYVRAARLSEVGEVVRYGATPAFSAVVERANLASCVIVSASDETLEGSPRPGD